jgi:POT family proton-dependent oligopeptide transporter
VTDPVATLPIYTGLFLHLGYAACGAALLAILLLPLLRRLARAHASG